MTDLTVFATFAEELADAARGAIRECSQPSWSIEDKNAGGAFDPVTAADRAAERAMRELIRNRFPEHGISGEEYGTAGGNGSLCWSLDPIDGTRAFICGLPSWTILIALLEEGRPILGLIDAPRLDERFLGYGATAELIAAETRAPLRTSGCRSLREARLSTTDPYLFQGRERDAFGRVRSEARLTRYGLDGYAYARLAAGDLDLIIESGLAPHDLNALLPVVTAARGAVSDWSGGSDFTRGALVAAASDELLAEALERLG